MKNLRLSVRQIAFMGVLVAMSIVLDMIKVYQLPNGGSINLAMVGLMLIALSFPWWQTWLASALVFGLLTALLDGYVAYYLFDYFFALSGFLFVSCFRRQILVKQDIPGFLFLTLGFMIAFIWRLSMHVVSGMLYFDVDFFGSLTYNLTYLVPSFLISFGVMSALYFSSLPQIIRKFTNQEVL